jgi:hypothetical protein
MLMICSCKLKLYKYIYIYKYSAKKYFIIFHIKFFLRKLVLLLWNWGENNILFSSLSLSQNTFNILAPHCRKRKSESLAVV